MILGLFAAAVLLPATIVALAYLAMWDEERDR